MSRLVILFLTALLCLSAGGVHGQTLPLTSVEEVLRVKPGDAGRRDQPVKLKGVIVSLGPVPQRLSVHDGRSTVVVMAPVPMPNLRMGQSVEVEGQVSSWQANGRSNLMVAAKTITPGAIVPLPEPKRIGLSALNAFAELDQWVSAEGYVVSWRRKSPFLTLTIVSREVWSTVTVWIADQVPIPASLHGAKIRLTGINTFSNHLGESMGVTTLDQMQVLKPGTADVFEAPLVSVADLNARKAEQAQRLRVRGTLITVMESRKLILHGDDGQSTALLLADPRAPGNADTLYGDGGPTPAMQPGDVIEVVGSIVDQPTYAMKTYAMILCYARVVGKGVLPKPDKVSVDTLIAYRTESRWVTIDAVVHSWMLQSNGMTYAVGDDRTWTTLSVRSPRLDVFPKDLFGARLRFTGLATGLALNFRGAEFLVPNPSFVEVLKPGHENPFDVSEYKASDIAARRIPAGELVKTKGVIVGQERTVLYVRAADAALCVTLQQPWARPGSPPGIGFADSGPTPTLKLGDEVEVAGYQFTTEKYVLYDLAAASVRVTGHQDNVAPVETTFAKIAAGGHTADLVKVRGRLLTMQVASVEKSKWRTTMLLTSAGQRMTVVHQSPVLHPFDTLRKDDELILQAVVDRATPDSPRQLWLFSPADVKSLGVSPEIVTRRLWLWGGATVLGISILGGWVLMLRRAHRRQAQVTAELKRAEVALLALNQTLEQRVDERTTELQKTQAELRRALDQERELSELKSRFVTMVSHEFRTPLGIIMSAIELMRHYDERLSADKRQELQQDVFAATRHMAGLMEQVLLLGRVEAGKLGCKVAACDLEILIGKLTDECLSATNRKCPIVWRADNNLGGALADESLLRHIFGNLITNAVKYSPDGGEVLCNARRDGNDAVFHIIDHGIGIPEADMKNLFDAFHRCSNVGEIPGTGLGLVIVRRCVDLHGGTLEIDSVVGKGTTFTVRLPLFGKTPAESP